MDQNGFANTGRLSRFIFRLDRIRVSLWVIGLALFTLIIPPAFDNLYETEQDIDAIMETMANPAMTAMLGTGDLDHYTIIRNSLQCGSCILSIHACDDWHRCIS